ncbi:hypothetical protein [Intrasporangium flavum]|uniref:hypothetical protein n=1 Tax=Intrasporangium flavum TaxID=1428657 RepID=UPI001A979B67|nr:hypothetical protein [Intrasporangium flavum]
MTRSVRGLDRPGDDDLLQALLETDPGYAERVTGYPPGPSDGYSTLTVVPPDFDPADKHVLGLFDGERLVAAADVLHGYPGTGTAFVGLLIVDGTLRLAVVDTNAEVAAPFWERLGYRPTGETRPWAYDTLESTSRLWERPLDG